MSEREQPVLTPYRLGPLDLPNRLVMAPMTRSRALDGAVANPIARDYYAQRASAGLIVSEATQITQVGQGYLRTPGVFTDAQAEGWRGVTDAVHRVGGRIFAQLWHVGRVSHTSFQPGGAAPVAPSAIAARGEAHTLEGKQPFSTPRALETSEIASVVEQYAHAARTAKAAGFDGVELHGANGYLIDQFLRDGTNKRTDEYGGSFANRARFLLEIVDAVSAVWGADRVGVRISPLGGFNDMSDSDPVGLFSHVVKELDAKGVVYLHVIEGIAGPMLAPPGSPKVTPTLRKLFRRTLIANGGYTREAANEILAMNGADLVAFGVPFLANPDLVARFTRGAALNKPDFETFYAGEERGYTDYPTLAN
jgi:N-ethylmaleimide reductase